MKTAWEHNHERPSNLLNEKVVYTFPEHQQAMVNFRRAHHQLKVAVLEKAPWLGLPRLPEVTGVKYCLS